ncbi:YpoC family protein [Alkalihalobacillus sp. FSL W8-0930]
MTSVPEAFWRSPFYEPHSKINCDSFKADQPNQWPLFFFDINLCDQASSWTRDVYLPLLFTRWHELDQILSVYHEQEDKAKVASITPEFTALVLEALFWINNQLVPSLIHIEDEVDQLSYTPPNSRERIAFVLLAPQRYRSFVQMKSFMEELEKLYARVKLLEAKSTN